MTREYKQQNSVQHKCPNCGASLRYEPQSGKLYCDHCKSYVGFSKDSNVVERNFDDLVTFRYWKDSDITSYRCDNCGATVVAPRTTLATKCPYCSSPVVIQDMTGSIVKPDSLIPFEITAQQAAVQLSAWKKRKIFAPQKFRKQANAESVKGVYVPAWTFDAETSTKYNGTVGYNRTRKVRINGKVIVETYVEWRRISGVIDSSFDDIFVRANDNVPDNFFRQLQPFPQSKYKVYDDEYLAGYLADHYTLEPLDAFTRAKQQMRSLIQTQIRNRYNADVEGTIDMEISLVSKSFKYMLIPVYVAASKYGKKLYNQYISGMFSNNQNNQSKVSGKAPVSPWKVLLTVLAGIGAIVGLVWLMLSASGGI